MTIVFHLEQFQNHMHADQTNQELIHQGHAVGDVVAAFAVQDMKQFCTRALVQVNEKEKNKVVMTIFCHPENLHCHKHSVQTSSERHSCLPIQLQNLGKIKDK